MSTLAARLDRTLKAAGVAVVSVSIGMDTDKATWTVQPASLQGAAQSIIDAFDPNDPALDVADRDAAIKQALDTDRLISAVVWCIIDTFAAPATGAKYQAARTKIIAAYQAQPWKV